MTRSPSRPSSWTLVALVALVTILSLLQTIQYGRRESARVGSHEPDRSGLAHTIEGRELSWVHRALDEAGVEVEVVERETVPAAYPWNAVSAVTNEDIDARGRVRRIGVRVESSPRRPLGLGRSAGDGCATSPARSVRETFDPVLGTGPVFFGGPSERGVLRVEPGRAGMRRSHVYLIGIPSYSGPVLVRGGRLGGRGAIYFRQQAAVGPGHARTYGSPNELHLPPGDGLRAWGATLSFPGTGCYALQIDGPGVQEAIVFEVRDRTPKAEASTPAGGREWRPR